MEGIKMLLIISRRVVLLHRNTRKIYCYGNILWVGKKVFCFVFCTNRA